MSITNNTTYPDGVIFRSYDKRYCPKCNADFKGVTIPEDYRINCMYGKNPPTHYSRIIGVEIPGKYDGVSLWKCPDCNHQWNARGTVV